MTYPLRAILLFPLTLIVATTYAQIDKRLFRTDRAFLAGIKVTENNVDKPLAWTGGLNRPQFGTVDLNHDGKKDMVVFEVPDLEYSFTPLVSNNVRTFLNVGQPGSTQYRYAPEYEYLFPYPGRFMKLLDYNCDGIPDYLYGDGFLNICDGVYNSNNNWSCTNCRPIRYVFHTGNNSSEVPCLSDDVPGIADLNNDQDLDFVAFALAQSGLIELYRNMRHEDGMVCDSTKFRFKDWCWGKVDQDVPREHILQVSCDNSMLKMSEENKTTHGSNGVCLFDADGDGDYDALIGNSNFSDIQFLKNGKTEYNYPVDTMISQDTTWPSAGHKLHMPSYPMAHWVDVDDDNDKDIVIAPQGSGRNYASVALYLNTGSDAAPSFVYQKDSFLMEEMVDAGSDSYPFLYDYNKDGKKDLFIGSSGYYQPGGTYKTALLYLENTSSGNDVSFKLVTRNFLNIGSYIERGAAIAIGDLDGDGLDDLVAGRLDGSIICFRNHAASANVQPNWQLWQSKLKTTNGVEISISNYATPFIYDIDKDGKNDLIVGNGTGYLTYYKNVGNGQIGLEYKTNKLGDVKVVPNETFGYSAPYIGPIDNSGNEYLMVGSGTGAIYRYTGFQNGNVTTPYTLVDTMYSEIKIPGQFSSVAFGDVWGNDKYELFIGSTKGGLFVYHQVWDVHVDEVRADNKKLELHPNPAKNRVRAVAAADFAASSVIQLFDNVGRSHAASFIVSGKAIDIDVSLLPPGVYICRISSVKDEFKAVFVKQ